MKKWILAISSAAGLGVVLFFFYTHSPNEDAYFNHAAAAIAAYRPAQKNKAIVIDYRKNLFSTRLYLLDMVNRKVVLSSSVSHAWNSGFLWPEEWSNVPGSEKSSEGVYVTREVYSGRFGKAMRLEGLDRGLNDNARSRAIVFHATAYYLPFWSKGCFVTDQETNSRIIDLTAAGTLVCIIH